MRKSNYLLIAILVVWMPLFMGAWDKDKPAATTSLRQSNPEMLENQSSLETAFDVNHDFTTGSTQTGRHEGIEMLEQADIGTGAEGVPILGAQTASGKAELTFTDEDDNDIQITSGGSLGAAGTALLADTITASGLITANGGVTLGAGDDLIGSATSDITINTNKFTVDGATGNTVVGGTFDSTGVATLADGSLTKTSAAPTTDAMIANKKYVDDQVSVSDQVTGTNDITTTSATYVDMTGMSITMTTSHGSVLLMFSAYVGNSQDTGDVHIRFFVDSTDQVYEVTILGSGSKPTDWRERIAFQFLVEGLSDASHTFAVQWHRGSGGTAAQTGTEQPRSFTATEI